MEGFCIKRLARGQLWEKLCDRGSPDVLIHASFYGMIEVMLIGGSGEVTDGNGDTKVVGV